MGLKGAGVHAKEQALVHGTRSYNQTNMNLVDWRNMNLFTPMYRLFESSR